jgi:hypothetical protein
MLYSKKIIVFSFIFILFLCLATQLAFAAKNTEDQSEANNTAGTVTLTNPLSEGKTDIPTLLGTVINSVMGVIGSLALVMFIYGGITWMLSTGNQERVTKGKNILIWAAVGLVIIFSAYALVKFVLTAIVPA